MLLVSASLSASGWGPSETWIIQYLSGGGQVTVLFSTTWALWAVCQANLVGFCYLDCRKRGFPDPKSRNGRQTKLSIDIVVIRSELSLQSRVFVVTWWLANLRHVHCWLAIPSYEEWSNLMNVTKTVVFIHACSELKTHGMSKRSESGGEQWTKWSSSINKRFGVPPPML